MQLPDHFQSMFEPELAKELVRRVSFSRVKAGEVYIRAGDPVKAMPILLSGLLRISRMEEDGRELFLYYLNPDESCAMTFTCCMQRHLSEIQAVAEEATEMLLIPLEAMDEWLIKFPSWKDYVMKTILNRFNELLKTIDLIAFQNLDQRLVSYLKEKSKALDSSLINLSHERIAGELATSRVVVSRLLKKLERDGKVLLYRNQIKVLDEL